MPSTSQEREELMADGVWPEEKSEWLIAYSTNEFRVRHHGLGHTPYAISSWTSLPGCPATVPLAFL
jgi:hypothetical protein